MGLYCRHGPLSYDRTVTRIFNFASFFYETIGLCEMPVRRSEQKGVQGNGSENVEKKARGIVIYR
jgi:hypothetical protein